MEFEFQIMGKTTKTTLGDGQHLVGRSPEADLHLPAPEVSSKHAWLRIEGDRLSLEDLGSKNGTQVDGRALAPGDGAIPVQPGQTIRVAGIEIRHGSGIAQESDPAEDFAVHTQVSFSIDDTYRESARQRITAELSNLFELIAAEDGADALATRTCEFVSKSVRADRVVLLEDQGEGTAPSPRGSWCSSGEATEDLRLSQTILSRVIGDRTSIVMQSIDGDSGLQSESIVSLGIRSAMAVPLFDNERVRGILYVDSLGGMNSYSEDDLQLVTATANAVAVRLRNMSMEREQATAAEIQRSMLPTTLPTITGHELLVHIDMCRAVGGDLYHVLPFADGHTLMALGDVTGKGMPAALVMSACMVLLGTLAETCDSVAEVAEHIHRQLFRVLTPTQFVTLFLGDLDPASGTLRFVNAGHEPPLVIGNDGTIRTLSPGSPPVAMVPELGAAGDHAELAPGELMMVFSDGIPEATLDGEDFLGLDGVRRILVDNRTRPLTEIRDLIAAEVSRFLGGSRPSDDISLLLLRRDAG